MAGGVGCGQRMVREVDGDDMRWVHVVQGRGIRCSRRGGVTEKTRGAGQDGDLSLRALQFTWGKPSPVLPDCGHVLCHPTAQGTIMRRLRRGLQNQSGSCSGSSVAAGRLCRPCLMHEALHEAFQSIHHH